MSGRSPGLGRAGLAIALILIGVIAYMLLWTTFMVYDDEGYVLYSLRAYAEHGHLYTEVYSQYGPFFFVLFRGLHALGLAFTNTAARELALIYWVGTAALCAGIVWRASGRSFSATLATLVAVFLHLSAMSSEPSHPGGLIALLVATAAWAGTHPTWKMSWQVVVIAAIGTMLVLTKINVGLLLFIGAGAWWALQLYPTNRWWRLAIAAGFAAVPVLLMWPSRHENWIPIFMLLVATGGIATTVSLPAESEPRAHWRDAWLAMASVATVTAFTVLAVWLHGTSLQAVLEGTLLGPLRHPSV